MCMYICESSCSCWVPDTQDDDEIQEIDQIVENLQFSFMWTGIDVMNGVVVICVFSFKDLCYLILAVGITGLIFGDIMWYTSA